MTIVGRAIGLVVLCFIVGLILSRLGITAHGIFTDTWGTIVSVFERIADLFRWAIPYILLGAVVVLPVYAIALIQRLTRRRPPPQ